MNYIINISNKLYSNNIKNQIIDHFNLKKSLKYANKINVKKVIIVGEEEFKKSKPSYKNLETGEQSSLGEEQLFEIIKNE
jgi:histidyl-tRNA synthetase